MKKIETIVSGNIKKILKEYNINQNELAKIAGVSESTVGKWVLEKATPRMGAIEKIANHFNLPKSYILKEDEGKEVYSIRTYPFYPTAISAGLPIEVDGITEAEKISIPDSVMGKWAGRKDIFITKITGDSMNNVMPDGSLIAVKSVTIEELKNDDIVVFRDGYDYSVKRYFRDGNRLIFRPDSTDRRFTDQIYDINNVEDLKIKGKVILYIVELN